MLRKAVRVFLQSIMALLSLFSVFQVFVIVVSFLNAIGATDNIIEGSAFLNDLAANLLLFGSAGWSGVASGFFWLVIAGLATYCVSLLLSHIQKEPQPPTSS